MDGGEKVGLYLSKWESMGLWKKKERKTDIMVHASVHSFIYTHNRINFIKSEILRFSTLNNCDDTRACRDLGRLAAREF